ncbi:MAG: hypothetical protein OQK82_01965 [Candidatus Pacearchaeota archaeon]|nr:hypothetical protein [Candidatus Pacearchaeota archaeon]
MGENNFLGIRQKRGQITLFVILSIVVVVLGILVYMFYPQISSTLGVSASNPEEFMQLCLEDTINENLDTIAMHGGSIEPEHYFLYDNTELEYLCYTNEYYEPCVMQQPFLRQHIEEELMNSVDGLINECFDELESSYTRQGYDVNLVRGASSAKLLPKRVEVTLNSTLTLTKEDSERIQGFSVIANNNLYELASIAISILGFETKYGDSETTDYMNYYHYLKVQKKKQGEGSTVYILINRDTEEMFQFAVRSYAWPSGYGFSEFT